jgi:hypothetical protein
MGKITITEDEYRDLLKTAECLRWLQNQGMCWRGVDYAFPGWRVGDETEWHYPHAGDVRDKVDAHRAILANRHSGGTAKKRLRSTRKLTRRCLPRIVRGWLASPKNIMTAKIETITITLTREEAYALCNKLDDQALVTHGGYCEFDQIKLLQKVGKEIGTLVGHHAAKNDLTLDVKAAVYSANRELSQPPSVDNTNPQHDS